MSNNQPIGYFVHHQGRGHAERAASIANQLSDRRAVTLFCAKEDIFPKLADGIEIVSIPSLFEPTGREPEALQSIAMPDTVHCAPLGWRTIREAMAIMTGWFARANPALFVTDVSAELGQLARLCSVPHVAVLQHGDRSDPGHMAAYHSAVGLLAPYVRALEQSDRLTELRDKTHYASGVGIDTSGIPSREEARKSLDLDESAEIVLVIAGGGGEGTPSAPITLGARAEPYARWITIGKVRSEWHETPPGNLEHRGWVDNPHEWIAAADRVVSSCGNTTVHMVLAAGRPWVVVPEWRYFNEQICKAEVLDREGLAAVSRQWPSHAGGWQHLWRAASNIDCERQREIIDPHAAAKSAEWLDELANRIWSTGKSRPALEIVA